MAKYCGTIKGGKFVYVSSCVSKSIVSEVCTKAQNEANLLLFRIPECFVLPHSTLGFKKKS